MQNVFRVLRFGVVCTLVFLVSAALGQRVPVEGTRGMIASASMHASEAGLTVLKQGGNAVDAAVATGFALAVTYPKAGNLGGGGFLLLRTPAGLSSAIDFRETAPAAATRDMYIDPKGQVVPGLSTRGYLASGVPGTVAGLAYAWKKYGSGKVSWAHVIEPARVLAAQGFPVSAALAKDLQASVKLLEPWPDSKRIFLRGGMYWAAGDRFIQTDLAATLARLQEHGPEDFYAGETARRIAADQKENGGLLTLDDLRNYRVVEREPLRGRYRGYEVITMPPPSSGGIALLQMLAWLETRDVASLGHNSAAKVHLFVEAMRRAFHDRAEFLGDPDFVDVPTLSLLAPDYLRQRFSDFSETSATPSDALPKGQPRESTETTHYSVVDAAGTAVAVTYTLNGNFGSGVTATGTGILLNNEMDDFTSQIGVKNMYGLIQGSLNAIAPGKRPLSSMTPTLVLQDGKVALVTGSPGGPTIITTVLQVITNVIDHEMTIAQAVAAPRFHHQWQPDVVNYEPFFASPDTLALLKAKGHTLSLRKLYSNSPESSARSWGDAESIAVDPKTGLLLGVSDPRSLEAGVAAW